jgi:hypothetical protein
MALPFIEKITPLYPTKADKNQRGIAAGRGRGAFSPPWRRAGTAFLAAAAPVEKPVKMLRKRSERRLIKP